MLDEHKKPMQEWLKKIVETTEEREERKKIIPHQPFYISKRVHCPICKKIFEGEPLDFTLDVEYLTCSYDEWKRQRERLDYCPLCGETIHFDFIYVCMICGKKVETNMEKKDKAGLSMILCDSEECRATFKRNHKRRRCPLCNHGYILSLDEDYTMFQLFEERTKEEWTKKIEEANIYCPLCGSTYLLKHCIICGNVFRTFHKQQLTCKSSTCIKLRLTQIKRKRRLKRKLESERGKK